VSDLARRTRIVGVARSVIAPVILLASLLSVAPLRAGPTSAVAATAVAMEPVTPILSVRRLPDWIENTVADEGLAVGLPAIFARLGAAAASSCLVVTRGAGLVYAAHPTEEVIPASNMKVLTASAVLDKLGAATRIVTRVTASVPAVGGTLHGNLYLIGGGDPLLWTPNYVADQYPPQPLFTSLATLAARVKAAGITTIRGNVIGDEALFDRQRYVPTWDPDYASEEDVGPLSALDVDNGFRLTPPYGAPQDPAVLAAEVFRGLLKKDGIKITGSVGPGVSPAGATPVTSIASAPLGQEIGAILRVSDDTGAEIVTKLLGRRVGAGGTTTAGVAVIRADLAAHGLPAGELHALDGSGLDRGDRVTCTLMADVLRDAGTTGALFAGLPIAGRTGTLAPRMVGTPAAGRLHAKTGTLNGVAALSGFVLPTTPGLAPIVFSFIANNVTSTSEGDAIGDALGVDLARTRRVPPLTDALPLPPRAVPAPTVPPSTVSPSTVSPSTVSPSTVSPSTVSPSTVSPSTTGVSS
jgi:D-alanyl-D-alanine carboxypeptidase/D-alanyl-D-alanine-endopeptidase (penicillin-binding protein 4)